MIINLLCGKLQKIDMEYFGNIVFLRINSLSNYSVFKQTYISIQLLYKIIRVSLEDVCWHSHECSGNVLMFMPEYANIG